MLDLPELVAACKQPGSKVLIYQKKKSIIRLVCRTTLARVVACKLSKAGCLDMPRFTGISGDCCSVAIVDSVLDEVEVQR